MKARIIGKKTRTRMAALAMSGCIVLTGFGSNGQVVFAQTNVPTTESAITEESVSEQGAPLVEDAEASGVYYNANSQMTDFRDETIYFVMTTRFYDGDSSNNVQCWDGKDKNVNDDPWRGDFKGLIEKLDYIKALGFTSIWITPVVKNASGYDYHGYHAINFQEVDPRYESEGATYQDLIDAAHAKGMKIIQDVVFNHTGNWGEENLYPMFTKNDNGDLADVSCMVRNTNMEFASDYDTYLPENDRGRYQLRDRLKLMNADSDQGKKYDMEDIYHHNGFVGSSFEQPIVQYGSIHYADCMDLNTENPKVYKYLVDAYSKYIAMGVDAFRVDTVKHISRLTLNKAFNQQLNDAYNKAHGTTGEGNFFMFGEVCTRWRGTWNSNNPSISTPFYTWKETKDYAWDDSVTAVATETNCASARQHYVDNSSNTGAQQTSNNAFLNGNEYHTPDHSQHSGMNVIDFPMHWAFKNAGEAYQQAREEDPYYNDSTFNVTYVDSHDYAPDNAPENTRFDASAETWAENLNLIFTFRGIPCIYYGSEIQFKKGMPIDKGPDIPLEESGRAYFGDLIEGSVDVVDFARYSNATGAMAETLNHPLSKHIQRLNRLRAAIPALRKGQYSTEGCNGQFAYKRRYTDEATDSFALIALTSDATFSGIPNGTYTDAITGDVKNVTNGSLSTSGIKGQGDLRVYVLSTSKTPAPGMIDGFSDYMSGGSELVIDVVAPTGISIDKQSASLDLGETTTFTATVTPSNATNKSVTWTSSDAKVATVSNGVVTARGEGTATITAATSNGIKKTATVTVEAKGIKVEAVTLDKTSVTLEGGESVQVNATITPANAEPKYAVLTWTSSDAKVATVNNSGLITGVKKGTATITATTASGKSASVNVTVNGTVIYGDAIHFEKPSNWGNNINVYFWTGSGEWKNASWPGVAMTETDPGVYSIEWPEGKTSEQLNVIFNDGGNQTADLVAKLNGYYNQSGYVKTVTPVEKPVENQIEVDYEVGGRFVYDGTEQRIGFSVTCDGNKLTENVDYTVTYTNNINAGMATITIKGCGKYAGTKTHNYIIYQADMPANAPTDMTVAANTKLSTITLGNGWSWSDSDKDKVVASGAVIMATAVYSGADEANYRSLSVSVVVTGQSTICQHTTTEVKNAVAATCTANGYTGDTCCKSCGVTVKAGSTIAKKAHTWNAGVVTKEATATEEGVRTYTCTTCKTTKTESIPKKTHTHVWDEGEVTTEPTETEAGEKIYTCNGCTESKIEVIPPLGESRISITVPAEDVDEGETIKHKATSTTYRITKNTEKKKEVEWVITKSKKKTIKVPDSILINNVEYKVTSIADDAFRSRKTITTIVIGNNVKEIGSKAFYKCKNLKKVTLGNNVKQIGSMAFYKCTNLKAITIPSKVNSIGKQAFQGCMKLSDLTILTKKLTYKNVGSKAFKGISKTATIVVPKGKLSKYEDILSDRGVSDSATIKKAK